MICRFRIAVMLAIILQAPLAFAGIAVGDNGALIIKIAKERYDAIGFMNAEMEKSIKVLDDYIIKYQGDGKITDKRNSPAMKQMLGNVAYLADKGHVVAAQLLMRSIRESSDEADLDETTFHALDVLIRDATNPIIDGSFEVIHEHYMKQIERFKAWPANLQPCVSAAIKGAAFDDGIAMRFGMQCLADRNGKQSNQSVLLGAVQEVQILREKMQNDPALRDHDHD